MNTVLRAFTVTIGLLIGISAASAAGYDPVSDDFVFDGPKKSAPAAKVNKVKQTS